MGLWRSERAEEAATPEATAEATEEVTPEATETASVELTESFTSSLGVTASYPAGWVSRETDAGEIEIANSAEALDAGSDPSMPIQPGQIGFVVLNPIPVAMLNMGDNPALTDVMTTVGGMLGGGGETTVGEVTDITLGERPAARIDITDDKTGSEGFLIGFMGDDSTLVVVAAVTPQGELATSEALLLEMTARVTYTAPAE